MPRHHRKAAVLLVISVCLASCSKGGGNAAVAAQGAAGGNASAAGGGQGGRSGRGGGGPVPVTTAKVESQAIPVTIPAVGTAEALQTGQVSDVHFREGQEVKRGDPLFTIDPRSFQATLAQAEAVLARDTATASNAAAQQARFEDLYKRGLLPRDQYETQRASSQSAEAT